MSRAASFSRSVHAGVSEIRESARKPRHRGPAPIGTNSTAPMPMLSRKVSRASASAGGRPGCTERSRENWATYWSAQ